MVGAIQPYQDQINEEDVEHWLDNVVTRRMILRLYDVAEDHKEATVSDVLSAQCIGPGAIQHAQAFTACKELADVFENKESAIDFLGVEG